MEDERKKRGRNRWNTGTRMRGGEERGDKEKEEEQEQGG